MHGEYYAWSLVYLVNKTEKVLAFMECYSLMWMGRAGCYDRKYQIGGTVGSNVDRVIRGDLFEEVTFKPIPEEWEGARLTKKCSLGRGSVSQKQDNMTETQ